MNREFTVPLGAGLSTHARHYPARAAGHDHAMAWRSGALLTLAHGAGAGHQHPFIANVADGLASRGVDVVTFNFPYADQKRRVPDRAPVLEQCFRAVIEAVRAEEELRERALFIGGKSMGGRMATHLAAQGCDGVRGVVVLGYPLHPPGRPQQPRVAHLPGIQVPVLVVQGEHDPFGSGSELEHALQAIPGPLMLHIIPGADHSLAVRTRPAGVPLDRVLTLIVDWMAGILPGVAVPEG